VDPLYGCAAIIDRARAAVERALSGEGRPLVFTGEPGIAAVLGRDFATTEVAATGGPAFDPVHEALTEAVATSVVQATGEPGWFRFAHQVRRTEGHQVVDRGPYRRPYRLVRHPAYLGVIAAHLGFALVFPDRWSLLAVLLLVVPAFVWRIAVEAPVLLQIPGYAAYA
jgi:hypothetical protein